MSAMLSNPIAIASFMAAMAILGAASYCVVAYLQRWWPFGR